MYTLTKPDENAVTDNTNRTCGLGSVQQLARIYKEGLALQYMSINKSQKEKTNGTVYVYDDA